MRNMHVLIVVRRFGRRTTEKMGFRFQNGGGLQTYTQNIWWIREKSRNFTAKSLTQLSLGSVSSGYTVAPLNGFAVLRLRIITSNVLQVK
jgi:hypothetical protein